MVYAQPRICPEEWDAQWDAQTLLGFWYTNSVRRLDNNQQKKKKRKSIKERTCWIVDLTVPDDHRVKMKESEKKNKYLDLARELRKHRTWSWRWYQIVIDALGTVICWMIHGLEVLYMRGRVETIQTRALLRSARILRRVLETWGDFLSFKFQWENNRLTLVWNTLYK